MVRFLVLVRFGCCCWISVRCWVKLGNVNVMVRVLKGRFLRLFFLFVMMVKLLFSGGNLSVLFGVVFMCSSVSVLYSVDRVVSVVGGLLVLLSWYFSIGWFCLCVIVWIRLLWLLCFGLCISSGVLGC